MPSDFSKAVKRVITLYDACRNGSTGIIYRDEVARHEVYINVLANLSAISPEFNQALEDRSTLRAQKTPAEMLKEMKEAL